MRFFLLKSYTILVKEMITIDIEIQRPNRIKDFFKKLSSKSEDLLFFIIQKIPERFIPGFVINWLNRYVEKKTREIQVQIIRQKWQKMYLEKAVEQIRQQDEKNAQSED